jgi:hypothetical protein
MSYTSITYTDTDLVELLATARYLDSITGGTRSTDALRYQLIVVRGMDPADVTRIWSSTPHAAAPKRPWWQRIWSILF